VDRHPQEVGRKQIFQAIIRGLLPYYILNLLEKPHHGLEIANKIEVATGGAWAPSAGTLYPMLRRMETDGLIGGEWQRSTGAPRRVYKLLNEGRKERKQLRKSLIEELELASIVVDTHLQLSGRIAAFLKVGTNTTQHRAAPPILPSRCTSMACLWKARRPMTAMWD